MNDCILIDRQGAAALQTEVNGVRRWSWMGYIDRDSLEAFGLARGLQIVECDTIGVSNGHRRLKNGRSVGSGVLPAASV